MDSASLLTQFSKFRKDAFQPSPPPAPPMQGPPPAQGPPTIGGPAGAPPMDPASAPPQQAAGIPPQLEQMLSELAGGVQQLATVVGTLQQNQDAATQQSSQLQQELQQLKASLTAPSPYEGAPGGQPMM